MFLKRLIRSALKEIDEDFDPKLLNLLFPEHHLSHAASAFYPSPFEESAILTIDGVGEWATAALFHGKGKEIEVLKGSIKTIDKYQPNFAIASYHIINDKPTYIAIESFFSKIGYPYKTEFFDDGEIMTYAGKSINK